MEYRFARIAKLDRIKKILNIARIVAQRWTESEVKKMKTEFEIRIDKEGKGRWSLGMCLSHDNPETYFSISFFKWNISIDRIIVG